MSKPKVTQSAGDSSGQADNEKRKILNLVTDDYCSALLDISFQRMIKKEKVLPGSTFSLAPLELWSDDFEGKGDFGQYRARLVCLVAIVFFSFILYFVKCILVFFFFTFDNKKLQCMLMCMCVTALDICISILNV